MNCPHCTKLIFKMSQDGTKMKIPTSVLILHKSGDVEVNCSHCKHGVILPLKAIPGVTALKKGRAPMRHTLRKST